MSCSRSASSFGLRALAGVALVVLFAGASFGSTIDHGTGLAGLFQTITFSEFSFAPNTPITTQFSSLGVSFTPELYYDTPDALYANIVGDRLRSEEHTSELQSLRHLVCRLLLAKNKR